MADAFIYDHVRTPRGRGKPDGSLHSITPMQLAAQTLQAVRDRNSLDTSLARRRRARLRLADRRAGRRHCARGHARRRLRRIRAGPAAEPLLRLGPRGHQQRRGAGDVRPVAGRRGGRRRVDVARADRQRRRRLGGRPRRRLQHVLRAAGRGRGPDCDARRLHARDRRRVTPSRASVVQPLPGRKDASPSRSCRSGTSSAASCSTATNTCARMQRLRAWPR